MFSTDTPNEKLAARGILDAARHAGVTEFVWQGYGRQIPGLAIPLYDEFQQLWKLSDGRPGQRWKNLDSEAKPKYRFGYPDSLPGQHKPEGCDIYIPNVDIQAEVAKAGGALIIACGEPDTWTFLSVGYRNVISFFGEKTIPPDLVKTLQRWGVTHILYYPDRDDTGRAAAEKLALMLVGSDIDLTIYELPETVNTQPVKDINDLYRALGCDPDLFRLQLESLPVDTSLAAVSMPLTSPEAEATARSSPRGQSDQRELPENFYRAIEERLGVRYDRRAGWSKPVACPFQTHEHDDRGPAAYWHPDKHILHCFKCGHTWLAVETGEELGLDWRDYTEKQRPREVRAASAGTGPKSSSLTEASAAAEPSVGDRLHKPTDDEIGVMLLSVWDSDHAFFWGDWHYYHDGVWALETNVEKLIWDTMVAAKSWGYKPSKSKQQSVEDYLRAQRRVPDEQIDRQDHLINLANGVYNLKAGQLEAHQREAYQIAQLGFAYDAQADCPLWHRCLGEWLITPTGEPDEELRSLLQEAMGYTLTTDTSLETAFMLYGAAGSGKSQVIRVVQGLLGDAHISLNLNDLDKNSYQLANVPGKRAITCTEAASRAVLADDLIKQLVSGEEIVVRQIYGEPFRFTPRATIWWAVNERPQNRDRSNAIYRRLQIIPFHHSIPLEHQDRKLGEKLLKELPGIFNWALEGLARLRRNGKFTQAAQVLQEVQDYKLENDTESACLADVEWFSLNPGDEAKANHFYLAYAAWCDRYGHRAESSTKVAEHWKRLGLVKDKRRDGNYYLGVELTPMATAAVRDRQR